MTAQTEGRQLLTDLLGTPVAGTGRRGRPTGSLDEATLDRMSDAGGRAVLLSADGIEQGRTQLRAGRAAARRPAGSPSSRCSPTRC